MKDRLSASVMPHPSSQRITPSSPSPPETEFGRLGSKSNSSLGHTLLRPLVTLSVLFAALSAPAQVQNDFSARFAEIKKYGFLQSSEKQRLIDSYDAAIQRFESRYSGDRKSVVEKVAATGSPYAAREFGVNLPLP
jgi:hypothetical protein